MFVEVEYQKLAAAWYSTLDLSIEVAIVKLHGARSCSIHDVSWERRERKVHVVQRKASGVEAWQRHAVQRRGLWRWAVGSLASAMAEIDDGVEEARRVHGGSSAEARWGHRSGEGRRPLRRIVQHWSNFHCQ
jgi:hypothetical protein